MTASKTVRATDDATARPSSLRSRLVPPFPGSRFWGWVGPLLVTAFGTFLRFNRLGVPHNIIFDETYYVPDAFGILNYGVEHNYVANRNALIDAGNTHIFTHGGEFVVHPPFGKILIAVGEWMFGLNPFGWRFAVAVVGSLSILLLARIARRMTRSTLLGCAAGLLLALDGLEFVMSRTAMLDIFVMFWVLAAFGCLVVDRDRYRSALADAAAADPGRDVAPRVGIRWWRLGAAVCIGFATASQWNGLWYALAFLVLSLLWDIGARRAAGYRRATGMALARQTGAWFGSLGLLSAAVYISTWGGWFASSIGYDRNWAAQHGIHIPVVSALISLYEYHRAMLHFDVTLTTPHPYQSEPWTWLVLSRPVAYYWSCPTAGTGKVCATGGAREVLAIGTPAIWWAAILALLVCLGWWLVRRDWRAGAVLLGVAAGWLTWFPFAHRTQFYFYAVAFDPFLVLAITLCLGLLIGSPSASTRRRVIAASITGVYLLVVLLNFNYLYPILAAKAIPYTQWLARMWYHGWI